MSFEIKNDILIKYKPECGETEVIIPDGVTAIGCSAFDSCKNLTSIIIPESVTAIGPSAFAGCTRLAAITIPDGVTTIGRSAFQVCKSLTDITIPKSVTAIDGLTFWGCESLTAITIPEVDNLSRECAERGNWKKSVFNPTPRELSKRKIKGLTIPHWVQVFEELCDVMQLWQSVEGTLIPVASFEGARHRHLISSCNRQYSRRAMHLNQC